MISSFLKPTTTEMSCLLKCSERFWTWVSMMLFPPLRGVRGLGNGFPRRDPMPAARMMIFMQLDLWGFWKRLFQVVLQKAFQFYEYKVWLQQFIESGRLFQQFLL